VQPAAEKVPSLNGVDGAVWLTCCPEIPCTGDSVLRARL
jgi:hypothetical protein